MIKLSKEQQFYVETSDHRIFHVKGVVFKIDGSLINDHQIEYFGDIIDPIGEKNENMMTMGLNTEEKGLYDNAD